MTATAIVNAGRLPIRFSLRSDGSIWELVVAGKAADNCWSRSKRQLWKRRVSSNGGVLKLHRSRIHGSVFGGDLAMLATALAGCIANGLVGRLISFWKELGMTFISAVQPPSKALFRRYGFAMLIGCAALGCDKVESLVDDAKKDMGVGAPAQNAETPAAPSQPAPVAATPQPAGPSADMVLANLKSKMPNQIDDQTLVAVASVPEAAAQVTELDLRSNLNLTGVGVAAVGKFNNMSKLQISSTPKLETADFNALGTLNALTELEASNTKIGNDNLAALSGLQQLKKLSLAQTTIQGAAVGQLASLSHLEELQLNGTGVDDEALAKLKSLPLKKLTLQRSRISNNGLLALNDHSTLEALEID